MNDEEIALNRHVKERLINVKENASYEDKKDTKTDDKGKESKV